MTAEQTYWNLLKQSRFELEYCEEFIGITNKFETRINFFLALSSSSSIAAWTIWQSLFTLWAIIIASSQVITTIKPLLPYKKRLELLQNMRIELSKLFLQIEIFWNKIATGGVTDEEINKKTEEFKIRENDILSTHLGQHVLPDNRKIEEIANLKAKRYLTNT